jgi:hypothetical protein
VTGDEDAIEQSRSGQVSWRTELRSVVGSTATPFKGSKDSGAFFGVPLDL